MIRRFVPLLCIAALALFGVVWWLDVLRVAGQIPTHPNLVLLPYRAMVITLGLLVSHVIDWWWCGEEALDDPPDLPRVVIFAAVLLSMSLAI